jgi:poly-gamma-glutamate synthesis protein (capsule biosynthesis protein)
VKRLAFAIAMAVGFAVPWGVDFGAGVDPRPTGQSDLARGETHGDVTSSTAKGWDVGSRPKTATLAFVGDVMLGRLVNEEIPGRPPDSFWGSALPVLRSADAVFANLECAITEHTRPWSRTPKVFHFRADPTALDVLRAGNIRYVSLANNHSLDFEEQGLLDTLQHLDAAGIQHGGAGRNLEGAMTPAMVEVAGLKVGVIALTDNEPPFAAGPDRPGTHYVEIRAKPEILRPVEDAAVRLRREGADLVVLSLHWGPNMAAVPRPRFRTFAREVLERGVDLIHGHSAHLVLYDTGDFLDDYAVDPVLRNDWSFIFLVEADAAGLRRLRMVPVRLGLARVDLATGPEFEAIRHRMQVLSADFGTPVETTDEGLEVTIRRPQRR